MKQTTRSQGTISTVAAVVRGGYYSQVARASITFCLTPRVAIELEAHLSKIRWLVLRDKTMYLQTGQRATISDLEAAARLGFAGSEKALPVSREDLIRFPNLHHLPRDRALSRESGTTAIGGTVRSTGGAERSAPSC